jgi:hypothetical protein
METTQKETIITQNMLIAQFMEIKPQLIAPDCYGLDKMPFWSITGDTPDKVLKDASILLGYHNDWNQLMEVVEKIENLGHDFDINKRENHKNVFIRGSQYAKITSNKTKIEAVHEAIIEFIKWYNKNK